MSNKLRIQTPNAKLDKLASQASKGSDWPQPPVAEQSQPIVIYLDHQASTPMHPTAISAMQTAITEFVANPHSSDHRAGWAAADAIESARAAVAGAINADADEIVFTSGATEANNLALLGLSGTNLTRRKIIVTAIEHKAVLGPARELQRRGFELIIAPVTRAGVVDLDRLAPLIDAHTLLVSCMAVNNEVGTVQPITKIADMCRNAGALLHVDAAQALAWSHLDVVEMDVDLASLSGHKVGGPKGVGALYVRRNVRTLLKPLFFGGEQEEGLRPGTLPTPLCAGFGAACHALPDAAEVATWRSRTAQFERELDRAIPGCKTNGGESPRHPGSISLVLPEIEADAFLLSLHEQIALSRGSACTSGTPEPSHVLCALGLTLSEQERTIRVGVGRFTTEVELNDALDLMALAFADIALLSRARTERKNRPFI